LLVHACCNILQHVSHMFTSRALVRCLLRPVAAHLLTAHVHVEAMMIILAGLPLQLQI